MVALAYLTTVLTIVLLAFYTWNPKARNYGGSTQGLRWLFWMIPLWLLLLAQGCRTGRDTTLGSPAWLWRHWRSRSCRSATRFAIPGAIPGSWMRLEHLDLYTLTGRLD